MSQSEFYTSTQLKMCFHWPEITVIGVDLCVDLYLNIYSLSIINSSLISLSVDYIPEEYFAFCPRGTWFERDKITSGI